MGNLYKMRNLLTVLLVIAVSASLHALPPSEPIPGEAILRFAPDAEPDSVIAGTGAVFEDSISGPRTFLVSFSATIPVDTMVNRLQARQGVLKAQPNFRHQLPEIQQMSQSFPDQNAPAYLEDVSPSPYYDQQALNTIIADSAALFSTGESVVVAVIDNGIDVLHPLFAGSIDPSGYDFVDDDYNPDEVPGQVYGHGTFVSGLIRLIAPDAHLMPIRTFDTAGVATTFDICEAIYWAIDYQADIINMSFGLYKDYPIIDAVMDDAFQAGVLMVAASGNDGLALSAYPAGHDGVLSVAALDSLELLADFSNYGDNLDVCAPGVNLYSALAGEYDWGRWSGTSFAAPLVTATCALILSRDAEATASELHCHIRNSARTDFAWGSITAPDSLYGFGCLDAHHAVMSYAFGDMDTSGKLNLADITALISFVYLKGAPAAIDESLGDFDCDGKINLADITGIISYVYLGGTDRWPCYRY